MGAARFKASIRRFQYADEMGQFVIRLSPKAGVVNRFTGQGTVDKNGLAILADNPTRLVVQRFDNPDRHDQLRKSANSINRLH
jgi:hypothetical protein